MCGILGVVERSGQPDEAAFERAQRTLALRGPDQSGTFAQGSVRLGHQRLSIIDVTTGGRQPMVSEDGRVAVVFNGEIYNYRELRAELQGRHTFHSTSDTEVLVHGFEQWSTALCPRLDGMFAFVAFDTHAQSLLLARDPFGKKPLYYYLDPQVFVFASEPKAILTYLRGRVDFTTDPLAVQKLFAYGYVPGDHAFYQGMRRLPPSTRMQFDIRGWTLGEGVRYWNLEAIAPAAQTTEAEAVDRIDALLREATRKRLQSDVPVGVFLSGGVDSSLVAAHVAKLAPDLEAYSVIYRDEPEADESIYAQRAAASCGIRLNSFDFRRTDVSETFARMLAYMDEPLADAALIPLHFIASQSRRKVTVALSGDGGDELFAGYPKHRAQQWAQRLQGPARLVPVAVWRTLGGRNLGKYVESLRLPFAARQFVLGSGSPLPSALSSWLPDADWSTERVFGDALAWDALWQQPDTINRSLYLDCRVLLPDGYLVKSDRATMATSLELRCPLLDKALAEYAFSLPGALKMRGGELKHLLKRVAARHVDPSCIYRPKRGFGVPLDRWIREELRSVFEHYLLEVDGPCARPVVERALQRHLAGTEDRRFELLRVCVINATLANQRRLAWQ